jgi:hypothetical protein
MLPPETITYETDPPSEVGRRNVVHARLIIASPVQAAMRAIVRARVMGNR